MDILFFTACSVMTALLILLLGWYFVLAGSIGTALMLVIFKLSE